MWGQTWGYIYDILEPYKNKVALDVTDELIKQVSVEEYDLRLYSSFL